MAVMIPDIQLVLHCREPIKIVEKKKHPNAGTKVADKRGMLAAFEWHLNLHMLIGTSVANE